MYVYAQHVYIHTYICVYIISYINMTGLEFQTTCTLCFQNWHTTSQPLYMQHTATTSDTL